MKAIDGKVELAVGRIVRLLNENAPGPALRDLSNVAPHATLSSPFAASITPMLDLPESPWTPLDGERLVCPFTVLFTFLLTPRLAARLTYCQHGREDRCEIRHPSLAAAPIRHPGGFSDTYPRPRSPHFARLYWDYFRGKRAYSLACLSY